ncbi:MAG: hypothetical protein PHX27_00665 [Candidatus ainarchaeum sp.]|nr:hypothetical protein [Candidatus ainarchaeum sp.]
MNQKNSKKINSVTRKTIKNFSKKVHQKNNAQGTIEYLIIIAIIIVIGLIVAGISTNLFQTQQITNTTQQLKGQIGSGGISIIDATGNTTTGKNYLNLKNTSGETLTITQIKTNDGENDYPNQPWITGNNTLIQTNNLCECETGQTQKSCELQIITLTKNGIKHTSKQTITVQCSTTAQPTKEPITPKEPAAPKTPICGSITLQELPEYVLLTNCENITNDGNYLLDKNLNCTSLRITADDVTIHGNYCAINGNIDASNENENAQTKLTIEHATIDGNIIANENANQTSGTILLNNTTTNNIITIGKNNDNTTGGKSRNIILNTSKVIGTITSTGGIDPNYEYGGSTGTITLTDSNVTTITSKGGDGYDEGGNTGTINLTNSNVTTITSTGGTSTSGSGGSTGTITLTHSNTTTIISTGGYGKGYNGGNSNTITLTNSDVTTINSTGGDSYYYLAGNGANIIINNSTLDESISTRGGSGIEEYSTGGNGGNVTFDPCPITKPTVTTTGGIGDYGYDNGEDGTILPENCFP